MARELTINNITDHVFDNGTTIYLNGTSNLDGTTTPLTINLDNFLLKEDEERLKLDFVDYANSIISQNILDSKDFRESVETLVEEEISNNLASEDNAGSVCAISSYSDNTMGEAGDAPMVYKVDYINSTLDSITKEANASIKSVETTLSASLTALSTKVADNTIEIKKTSTLSNTLKSDVNTLSNEVSHLSEKIEEVNNVANRVSNFDGRLNTLENKKVEENPTILTIQTEIKNLKSSTATKTQLDALAADVVDTSKIDAINNRIAPLETEVEKISAKDLEQDRAIAKNNTVISKAKDKIAEIETEVNQDIENLWAHVQECNNALASLANDATKADAKVLEDAKVYADTKLSKLSSGTTAELSRLEASITNLTSDLDNNKTDAYVDDTGRVYMSFESAFRVLVDKNAIKGVGDSVEGTMKGILADCENIHARIDTIEENFNAFRTSQESKNNEIQSTIAQVETKCDSECVTINSRIDELVEKIVKVECTTTAIEPEVQALKEQVATLKSQVVALNRQYQSLAQLNDAIKQNGMPMFADYFTENENEATSAPISKAETIFIKVPSEAGTLYYKVPLGAVEADNCILLEEAPTMIFTLQGKTTDGVQETMAGQTINLHQWLLPEGHADFTDGIVPNYNFSVDWGDGTSDYVNSENVATISHTYGDDVGEVVEMSIRGVCDYLGSDASNIAADDRETNHVAAYLVKVDVVNSSPLKWASNTFRGCTRLVTVSSKIFENCSSAKIFKWTFRRCISMVSIPTGIFDNCTSAITFHSTFNSCSSLRYIPPTLFQNCVNAETFNSVFAYDDSIVIIPATLFQNCVKATNFTRCFIDCDSIIEIPAGLFDGCPAATNFDVTFQACRNLRTVPSGLFDKCPNTISVAFIFNGCNSIVNMPTDIYDKCNEIQHINNACSGWTNATTASLNVYKVTTNYSSVFASSTKLRDVYLTNVKSGYLSSYINLLPNAAEVGESGTIHLKKNQTDATTIPTDEEVAAAANKGWTIINEGTIAA